MCWMCVEQEQSAYQPCHGCGQTFEKRELKIYDIFKEWGQLIDWIETHHRIVMFCENCAEGMNWYRESIRKQAQETKPDVIRLPETRVRKFAHCFPIGTHCTAIQQTLGIRCAKQKYGCDVVEEILQGFVYHDDLGNQIKRLTLQDIDETVRCAKCWLRLWQCNSLEVTI